MYTYFCCSFVLVNFFKPRFDLFTSYIFDKIYKKKVSKSFIWKNRLFYFI